MIGRQARTGLFWPGAGTRRLVPGPQSGGRVAYLPPCHKASGGGTAAGMAADSPHVRRLLGGAEGGHDGLGPLMTHSTSTWANSTRPGSPARWVETCVCMLPGSRRPLPPALYPHVSATPKFQGHSPAPVRPPHNLPRHDFANTSGAQVRSRGDSLRGLHSGRGVCVCL